MSWHLNVTLEANIEGEFFLSFQARSESLMGALWVVYGTTFLQKTKSLTGLYIVKSA